jgi:phospholipid/cholesterol/gamma-HCH transport system ATP-binding protein
VLFVASLSGSILAQQSGYQLTELPMWIVGNTVAAGMITELGPLLSAIIMAGRVGAGIGAEIGTMKVTDQLDAMRTLGRDPVEELVAPRVVAGAIMMLPIVILANIVGIWSGWITALAMLDMTTHEYVYGVQAYYHSAALIFSLLKAVFFGITITFIGCYVGMQAEGGAAGVGRTVRDGSRCSSSSALQGCRMIEIRGLRKNLNGKWVLNGVDLDIHEGMSLVIMGPSGTGKSVLLKHIVGLFDPDEGEVLVEGKSVPRSNGKQIREIRARISYVFQNSALFDSLTTGQNIQLGLPAELCRGQDAHRCPRVLEAVEHVNLEADVLTLMPSELSGGMQKRVAIARAIVGRQKYILYDEPTTGLDPVNASVINRLIARLQGELGATSVIVTHDVESAFFLGDRIVLLADGKVQVQGTPTELRESSDPVVREFLHPKLRS